ncbi:MAG: hypothetical protein FJY85_24020 [Deltaproteobacteria bacterium]|nr:hypothetical protein [Deltaproteobacteria bacterium]
MPRAIRLQTSKGTEIPNSQEAEISAFHRNWSQRLVKQFPGVRFRTPASAMYNCHGLTFASRRTNIDRTPAIQDILADDRYEPVDPREALPGDVVLYYSEEGEANHSGIVVEMPQDIKVPIICSKWGTAGEVIHSLKRCPSAYGPTVKFFRCRL